MDIVPYNRVSSSNEHIMDYLENSLKKAKQNLRGPFNIAGTSGEAMLREERNK